MSPRPGPRRHNIGFRASAEQRRELDLIAAEDEVTLSDILSRAADAEIKKARRRRVKT